MQKGFDPNADGKISLSEEFEHAFDTVQHCAIELAERKPRRWQLRTCSPICSLLRAVFAARGGQMSPKFLWS